MTQTSSTETPKPEDKKPEIEEKITRKNDKNYLEKPEEFYQEESKYTQENQTQWRQANSGKSWWEKQSLGFKASLAAALMGVLPVLTIGGIAYFLANRQFEKQINQNVESIAIDLKDQLQLAIGHFYGDIQVLSQLEVFTNPKLRAITTREEQEAILTEYVQVFPQYNSIAIFDLKGDVIAQSKGDPLPNKYDRNYIQAVLKTEQPFVSNPQMSPTTGELSVYFSAPIKDSATGKMYAVIRGRIPMTKFNEIFSGYAERGGNFHIIDSNSIIVSSENEEELNQPLAKLFPNVEAKIAEIEAADESLEPEGIVTTDEHEGEKAIVAVSFLDQELEEKYNIDWKTLYALEQNVALTAKSQLLWTLLLGTAGTAALVSILAIILVDRAIHPIQSVARAVEKIGQGDFDTRIPITGQDEIGQLSTNINQMTDRIKSLIQEQKVSATQASLLRNITIKMAQALETETVMEMAVTETRKALQSDRVVIYRFDENWKGKVIAESVDELWPVAMGATIHDPCFADKYVQKYKEGRVQATPDIYQAGLTECYLKQLEPFAVKANLVAPITVEGDLFGLLIAHQCDAPRNWEESEIDFFTQTATQIGPAIERTMLIEKQVLDTELAKSLKEISIKIAQTSNQDEVFNVAVRESRLALNSDRVIVYGFDPSWSGTVITESVADNWPRALGATIYDPCFADKYVEKYQAGGTTHQDNIYTAGLTECHLRQLEPFSVKANAVTPIVVEGKLMGLLIAHQCSSPRKWEQGEIDFLSQVATQIGPALERVSLLEKQKIAEAEQRREKERLQQRALELLMEVDPVSQGDLTIRANVTEDEIGTIADSYNAMIENLRKIVNQVQSAAVQVTKTTSENDIYVNSLSAESIRQAADIMEALDKIQAMNESIGAVAASAEQAEAAVKLASESVQSGDAAMNRTVDGILAIRETVAETAKKVKRLGESTQKISKVVNLISSFADQTNLLALNASIEAAHAGEEGRGFAVVADEVRSLARQSAAATAEIEKVVAEIQAETNDVVAAMETGTQQVVLGTKLVEETRQSLNQITAASAQITQLVGAIASRAQEQSLTSEEVTRTMSDVAEISNNTSQAASQVSESFKELLEVAEQLQKSVGQFKVK